VGGDRLQFAAGDATAQGLVVPGGGAGMSERFEGVVPG
jgi:hypothetical protein